MKFYEISETKRQVAYPDILGGNECHTPKSCCPLRLILVISRKSKKSGA